MAQPPSVVTLEVTAVPDPSDLARVASFVREPFVVDGEDPAEVLAPGSIRRHAFEAARAELDAGADAPSQKWRRRWSLLLGLDRTLNADTPTLADGTTLNPHQIDALSGTYAALLADAQARARGDVSGDGDALLLSFEDDEPTQMEEPPAQVAGDDDEDDDPSDDEDDEELESLDEQLVELPDAEPESESSLYDDLADEDVDEDIDAAALEDPNAHKRFWFEHATGAGKTVAAMGFVEACRTGGILILTHRRNLVDQFIDELQTRGYGERLSKPLLGDADRADGPVTIETYQWFVRNAGQISGAYTVVICDEAHTALGDKTSAAIRAWTGPIFIGMTATGALIARHVADLFPTQTSRFDLAQAARRGVIAPLRCLRIPPGPGVRTIAKVPLRKGEVDMEFDQDELAKLLDQAPFNLAIADLYKTRFRNTPGVVYTAGVQHAYNVAESFRALGLKAQAVSGETPKRELATILAEYDAGNIDVLINAQLLAEGWNSPRATICMHLAPTASKRIYQQRVGRVTRRHPGKEAGVVIDFVHPATPNDDPVVTLHSLLDRDVYRGGAIVVGPVRRGRGRRVKVERRVLPVTPDIERRRQVFERELWRIAVEQLDWGEQRVWAALAGAKASPSNWRRGRAMLNFDRSGELRRQFLVTALERNRTPQLRMRAVQEISLLREAEPFDTAIDAVGQWPRDERREASRTMLQAMADRRIGRRDQATAWIWRLAGYTRDVHEEYAAQRWPATKHLLGLLVNSSGQAHARNARRLVHGARQHDRRLQAALLAAAVAHTPEAEEVLREARTRLARKPGALSRDLLKDFPNGKRRKKRNRKKRGANGNGAAEEAVTSGAANEGAAVDGGGENGAEASGDAPTRSRSRRSRSRSRRRNRNANGNGEATAVETTASSAGSPDGDGGGAPSGETAVNVAAASSDASGDAAAVEAPRAGTTDGTAEAGVSADPPKRPSRRRATRTAPAGDQPEYAADGAATDAAAPAKRPARRRTAKTTDDDAPLAPTADAAADAAEPKPAARRRTTKAAADAATGDGAEAPKPATRRRTTKAVAADTATDEAEAPKPTTRRRTTKAAAADATDAPKPAARRRTAKAADAPGDEVEAAKPATRRRTTKAAAGATGDEAEAAKPATRRRTPKAAADEADAPKPATRRRTTKSAAADAGSDEAAAPKPATRRRTTKTDAAPDAAEAPKPTTRRRATKAATADAPGDEVEAAKPATRRRAVKATTSESGSDGAAATTPEAESQAPKPAARRRTTKAAAADVASDAVVEAPKPATRRRTTKAAEATGDEAEAPKPAARRRTTKATAAAVTGAGDADAPKPATRRRTTKAAATDEAEVSKPTTRRRTTKAAAADAASDATDAPKPAARRRTTKTAAADAATDEAAAKPTTRRRTTKAAAAVDDAPAKAPAKKAATTKRTTTRATAAKKPAAAKAGTAKTTAAKATAAKTAASKTTARRTTTRKKAAEPAPDEES